MKRKVGSSGRLRLSLNEEAFVLKEDYERRRKLRLLQVREQERGIAFQIREDIKRRRNQQLTLLAEELRTEWAESQTQKIKRLEQLYLASLRTMGEGHQQATLKAPDLNALERQAAERKVKAEIRHKEALKVQKDEKEQRMKQKTWHLQARKDALLVEKERSARVRRLPPPPPPLFENIDLSRITPVRPSGASYHHLSSLVDREMDAEQPDPHLAAEEEAKRLEDAERQACRERAERSEKAHVRGSRALTKIRLAQNQEKLLRELKRLQQADLARRRQTVAQVPAQLLELPYRRSEKKEEWQRELEFAFEDVYSAGRKMEGDLVLHLEPEPLPAVADRARDEDLDLSVDQELEEATSPTEVDVDPLSASDADVKPQQVPSKLLFKKLLSKIRNQKSLWTVPSVSEESSLPTGADGGSSEEPTAETEASSATQSEVPTTIESGPLTTESLPPLEAKPGEDSGPLTTESPPSPKAEPDEEAGVPEVQPVPATAEASVLLHPQEVAARVRMAARRKQIMELEEQKQKQLDLLERIEQQRLRLESDRFRTQLETERWTGAQRAEGDSTSTPSSGAAEDSHRQTIRSYQRHLLRQNRLHRQSVQAARRQLLEFQSVLRGTHLSVARTPSHLGPCTPGLAPEPWAATQKAGPCPGLQTLDSAQTLSLEPGHWPAPSQGLFLPHGAASADTTSIPELSVQAAQAPCNPNAVHPSSPGPCMAPSQHTLPASQDTSAQLLTCSSLPAASVSSRPGLSLMSSDTVVAQRDILQLLREQLDIQRAALQARQEAQECLQRGQPGPCIPPAWPPLGLSAPLPPARMGRGPESSALDSVPGMFSDHPGGPQVQAGVPSTPQPSGATGQEAPLSGEQRPKPAEPLSRHSLTPPPSVDSLSTELQDSSVCPQPQVGPVSILHQFLPLHNCLKLLQAQLAIQWDALEARHAAQAQLLARRPWSPRHSSARPRSSWLPPAAPEQLSDLSLPARERHLPPGLQDKILPPQWGLGSEPCKQAHPPQESLGAESETRDSAQEPSRAVGVSSQVLSQVLASEEPQESESTPVSHAAAPRFQEEAETRSQHELPAGDGVKAGQEMLGTGDVHGTPESRTLEPAGPLAVELRHAPEPPAVQAPELQARLQRLSQLLQPQRGQLQALQERLVAQRAALARTKQTVPEDRAVPGLALAAAPTAQPLPLDHSGLVALQQQLDSQKEALRARQAAQEGRLLQRLQDLERRVCAPWAAGPEGGPGLTSRQGTKPHDLLSSHPGEPVLGTAAPCPPLPLPLDEVGDTGPPGSERAGRLWSVQREAREELQGQEPLRTGPTPVHPECPGVPDTGTEDQRLVEPLSCPPLLLPAPVALAPGTVAGLLPKPLHRAVPRRPPKPPVARVQSGLELQQHELSLIQEGESPTPSVKLDLSQDRDPLRVSVSREQTFLGDLLARPASAPLPLPGAAAEAVKGQDAERPSTNLGHTVGAAQTRLSPAVEPAKSEIQETCHEPLSITISTGSFLSLENTDLSLTDTEPFPESTGPDLQACVLDSAPLGARPRPDPLDMAALVLQRADEHQDSGSRAWTPALHGPELTFPDVRQWQFQPLQPHLDLDVSPLTSVLDVSQASEGSRGSCSRLPSPTRSSTSPRVSPHPLTTGSAWPPGHTPACTSPHLADHPEGSEQAFHQLLPELASPEGQRADLPSILSIEAGDFSECLGPQDPSSDPSEQSLDKSLHVQFPVGTAPTLASQSPGEACGSFRSLLPHSEALTGPWLSSAAPRLCVQPRGVGEAGPWAVDSSSSQTETPTRLAGLSPSSESFSSRSLIPIWETESGRGIMEEPDLTLVSLSDVSSTEVDFSSLTLEKENEASPHAGEHCTAEPTETSPQLTALPRSTPEAPAGRKQRQRESQRGTQSCENSNGLEKPGGSGSCLKSMSRIQAPTAARRPFTQQRALRLYNYTAEIRQGEAGARQDAYAQNRAKAKDFHKRTLEKLRGKNTW